MLRRVVVFAAAVIAGVGGGLALSYGAGWREADLPGEVRAWVAGRLALLHGDGWRGAHLPGEVGTWAAGRLALLRGDVGQKAHRPSGAGTRAPGGLGPDVARLTVMRHHRVRTLSAADANQALALIGDVLPAAGPLTPVPDGPRFLANLRLNEQLVDITLGVPQSFVVGSRQISAVSALVIPFTGEWRWRIVVVQTGQVEVSGPLVNVDLIDLEGIADKEDGNP
jgi:hypothetical protein